MSILGPSVRTQCTVLTVLLLAMDADTDMTGLSKGPLNPADIGSRCAVMAGRDDRAFLHCAEQAQRPAATTQGQAGPSLELPRLDHSGASYDGDTRRYQPRRR